MKFQTTLFLALATILQIVHSNGMPGMSGWEWDFAPSCAQSCLSSAYPTTTSWSNPCVTATALSSCVTSACTLTATSQSSAISSLSSIQSSLCSVYSSCSSASSSCTWGSGGPFSPWDRTNGSRPSGWAGPGPNGFYTFSCTDGRTSGWSTAPVTITSTSTGTAGTSVVTTVVNETATLVAAAVTNSGATATATGNSAARMQDVGVWGMGMVAAAGVGAVVLL
ncbi:hypothetical protein EG329_000235 [Mollisiaceae sp. DMI_Dod_QoI]|nr:hypothetical protein EG329_000235 [Helotiales sp. DMI_Dod_QoI]